MSAEDKIDEFVKRCREAGGANVESIVLFGSAVSGGFQPGLSNLNLFCVLRDTSFASLETLGPLVKWWNGQKQPPPLCMTRQELLRSTDVFTIELLDMVEHHRVLFGEDVLQGLTIPTDLHRVQVEYELREKLVLLRQHLLLADGNDSRLWEVVLHSVSSFATLFRHALIVLAGDAPLSRADAVQQLARRMQFDSAAIQTALEVRQRKVNRKNVDVKQLCSRYLAVVEKVTAAVDQAFDSETRGHQ